MLLSSKYLSVIVILLIISISLFFTACVKDRSTFSIYLEDYDSILISDQDIEAYNWDEHTIELNADGIARWNSYISLDSSSNPAIPNLSGSLYNKPFSVRLDDEIIYTGKFFSYASSGPCSSIVILDALFVLNANHNSLRIENGYAFLMEDDLRQNNEIRDFFEGVGKLR